MAWRGSSPLDRARTAASSPRNDLVHPTHWLISTQVGSGTALPGLEEAVLGMKKGGVRRIVVPTRLSYTQPLKSSPGPVPDDYGARRQIERELAKMDPENFFVLEVEAVNVR